MKLTQPIGIIRRMSEKDTLAEQGNNQKHFTFLLIYQAIIAAKPPKSKRTAKVEFKQDIQKIEEQNCSNIEEIIDKGQVRFVYC